jgi:hypothetical protein
MIHLNKLSKFFLYITVISGSLWTGTYLLRMLLTYQIFEGTDLVLREYISPGSLVPIYSVLNPAIASTFTLFILFLLSFIIFLLTSKISLKQNGWLFIIAVIVLVTAPFEIYLMSIDYDILININYSVLNEDLISGLLRKRIKVLSSFPLIELFSYFAFYYLILFRPFTANK